MDAKWFRNSFIWLIVMVFVLAIAFQVFHSQSSSTRSIPLTGGRDSLVSKVRQDIANHQKVTISEDGNTVSLKEDNQPIKYQTTISDRMRCRRTQRRVSVAFPIVLSASRPRSMQHENNSRYRGSTRAISALVVA